MPRKITKGMFTSLRHDWQTPKKLYQQLNKEFHFDFDPCPPQPKFNGLLCAWGKRNFVNPPYGNEIKAWVKKAYEEAKEGKLVVLLIPSRTDTQYWHEYVMQAREIRFIKGRVHFDERGPAPFPSAIAIFDSDLGYFAPRAVPYGL